jgi:mRNA interferase RelE/StbE
MAKVTVHKRAAKYLQRLPTNQKEKIKISLKRLENDPLNFPGIVHMVGEWSGYSRIRIGNIRIIFWIDESSDTIFVDHIGPRSDIYKKS